MKKWIVIGVVLVLVLGGGYWFFNRSGTQPAVAQTMTAAAQKGKLEVKVNGSGSVSAVHSEDLTSSISSEIDEVLVDVNDKVKKGDELVTFTDGSDPITAPFDGTITAMAAKSGERPANSAVLGHITNYNNLQTVVSIDELDIPAIKKGQKAEITASAFENKTFQGVVTDVAKEGTVEGGVSSFNVTVHITRPEGLKIGMSTEADILTNSKNNALYIPIEAVRTNNEEKYVLIGSPSKENGSLAVRQDVKIGIHNDQYVEITSGLEEGQTVELPAIKTGSSQNAPNMMGRGGMGMGGAGFQGDGMRSMRGGNFGGSGKGGN
ncbi:efflux RND transporter periplasmic adaptor subunit [Peribacillus sp. B-H-3]|uniref:efflux RND transporter periplasmic adaptor subunit n=1 Tax=Peribacillus sp. B-H-3 TaxID=3400420 RepID=UPI003B02B8ED